MKRPGLVIGLAVAVAACTGPGEGPTALTGTSAVPATSVEASPVPTSTLPPATTTTEPRLEARGRVVGRDGTPVPDATVSTGRLTTRAESDGSFEVELSVPGTITVTRPGWTTAEVVWDGSVAFARVVIEPLVVRGLRVGAGAAADDAHFESLLDLAAETSVNAFVFDTKQEGGLVVHDTEVAEAHDIGAVDIVYDAAARLAETRERGLYAITRIVVFEDAVRATARPEEKLAGPWIDPRSRAAWDYNIALATDACRRGFDEVQFDYVRFPSGRTAEISGQLDLDPSERIGAIEGFLAAARAALEPFGCAVSADVFAIVVSVADDQGLGQRPEELSRHLDALSPMVYPSHYSPGWLGYADPNDHPYEVTVDAIGDALPRLSGDVVLRPWLQAFWWTDAQIRSSIQAAEDRGVGWLLWNVGSRFDRSAIPTDAEVGR